MAVIIFFACSDTSWTNFATIALGVENVDDDNTDLTRPLRADPLQHSYVFAIDETTTNLLDQLFLKYLGTGTTLLCSHHQSRYFLQISREFRIRKVPERVRAIV